MILNGLRTFTRANADSRGAADIQGADLQLLWLCLFLKGLMLDRLESFLLVLFVMH